LIDAPCASNFEELRVALNFDLNDLLAFRAVAELANFRRAAEAVHISQPAFSRRIDKLEQALGVKLLDRTTRRVSLTAVGRDFARKTALWLDELDSTLLAVRGVAATRMGEVTIACVPSTVYYHVSQVIRRYHETSRRSASRSATPAPTRCWTRWCAARPTSA
jgi:DNA-binding transcriptional LysR family regulator